MRLREDEITKSKVRRPSRQLVNKEEKKSQREATGRTEQTNKSFLSGSYEFLE